MKASIKAVAFAFLAASPCVALSQLNACNAADFAVEGLSRQVTGESTHIKGRLVNKCPQAVGAHIKVAIYANADSPLVVQDYWPAGTKNIPAKGSFAFESIIRGVYPAQKFDVRVLETKFWPVR